MKRKQYCLTQWNTHTDWIFNYSEIPLSEAFFPSDPQGSVRLINIPFDVILQLHRLFALLTSETPSLQHSFPSLETAATDQIVKHRIAFTYYLFGVNRELKSIANLPAVEKKTFLTYVQFHPHSVETHSFLPVLSDDRNK